MKAPSVFFWSSNISAMEKAKANTKQRRTWDSLGAAKFFYPGEVYQVAVRLSPHRYSIQHSTCLLTQARPSKAQIPIPCRETGLKTENTAPIAMADRMAGSVKIAAARCASQTPEAIAPSIQSGSYLALNWQQAAAKVRHTSIGRRFPTPQPTTSHLFWPNQRRNAASLLPIWLRNSYVLARSYEQKAERGAGGRTHEATNMPQSISSRGIFCTNGPPTQL